MIEITDTLAGDLITIFCAESSSDAAWIVDQHAQATMWGLDTESTGTDPYVESWRLKLFQFGNDTTAYVLPAQYKGHIRAIMADENVLWIAHNGSFDFRCLAMHLGKGKESLSTTCVGETTIMAHYYDPRPVKEGGIGNDLKSLCVALIDPDSGRWERELNEEFKSIRIPIAGERYKSGPRKGTQKYRKAKLSEGWNLIDQFNLRYLAYAAIDPVLAYRLWNKLIGWQPQYRALYLRDIKDQWLLDHLIRRGLPVDVPYTTTLDREYTQTIQRMERRAARLYGCQNIGSNQQVAATLERLGAKLRKRTPTGKWETSDTTLRSIAEKHTGTEIQNFIHCILLARQCAKRRASYTSAILNRLDSDQRIHPSIKLLGARTARMSVGSPPLQQLPTKDREADE